MRARRVLRRLAIVGAGVLLIATAAIAGWAYRSGFIDAPWNRPYLTSVDVPPVEPAVAFTGVTVAPMDRERLLADYTVVVVDGVIDQLGPAADVAVPLGALVIDGSGRYLLPGLIDMHVHVQHPDELALFLAFGVTTVRNMGANEGALRWMGFPDQRVLRDQVAAGELLGPRIVTAGPILEGRPPANPFMTVVTEPDQAAREVAAQSTAGYDFIKTYDHLDAESFDAVVRAAAQRDLVVAGHVSAAVGVTEALEQLHSIEHLSGYVDPDAAQLLVPVTDLPDVAAATAAAGTWNVPTMVLWQKRVATAEVTGQPEVAYVPRRIQRVWRDFARRMEASITYPGDDYAAEMARLQTVVIDALRAAGAGILLGTDTDNAYLVPGHSAHEELGLLTAAGLTPFEAIAAGTRDAAMALGLAEQIGTIAAGKRADLVLVEGDPFADVGQLRRIAGVLANGRWLPRSDLDMLLDELVARNG